MDSIDIYQVQSESYLRDLIKTRRKVHLKSFCLKQKLSHRFNQNL